MKIEEWRPIPDFIGLYEASTWGRIRSVSRTITDRNGMQKNHVGRVLKPRPYDKYGHVHVSLRKSGSSLPRKIHRLVLQTFVGPAPEGMVARHLDGDPSNNSIRNLEWATPKENSSDMKKHGTNYYINLNLCKRGHELADPNLTKSIKKQGNRGCLACNRTHGYLQHNPGLKGQFQAISDSYYAQILKEKK